MSLVSITELRALVPSPLEDSDLQIVLNRVEQEITDDIGIPYVDPVTSISEQVQGDRNNLFLKRPISSVDSITDENGNALSLSNFIVWNKQGRLQYKRHYHYSYTYNRPNRQYTVVYVPADRRQERKQAIIDLVRVALSQTALKGESVGGEYSYSTPSNWEEEKRKILRRITLRAI